MPAHNTPSDWFKGLAQNWRNDLVAAVSVSLVALPLALGIAIAAGAPHMSGVISAVVGGVVTTFLRGSHVAINGPANSLIALVLVAIGMLDDGTWHTFNYILAAFIVSGGIQVVLGIFRLGRIAEMIPSSVIHGILAAIGVIIVAKQLHVALGTTSDAKNMVGVLLDVFRNIKQVNPFVAVISLLGMLLLIFHARISYKFFHFLPAPMWVLILAVPFVFAFNFFEPHAIELFGKSYNVGPDMLVSIPHNILDGVMFPDFSKLHTGSFWLVVISISLITTVETLASTKAVDKIDPYKRKTNLNKDLVAVGLSTMVSGAIGGLPVVTVILRSTVNVHNNGRTRWSNFFHGILILVFVFILSPYLQMVPLAALAAILVFSGFKLTAPRVYANSYGQGMEQLLFMVGTMIITLYTNLLWGILGGIVVTLGVHILLARVPVTVFFRMVFKTGNRLIEKKDGSYELKIKGVANFLTMLRLNKLLDQVPKGARLKINISTARLVDMTVLENLDDFKRMHRLNGGKVKITGAEHHVASTNHRFALKSQTSPMPVRLSSRQVELKKLAIANDWVYRPEIEWEVYDLYRFHFFESRPIEYKTNVITGEYKDTGVSWELSDITFDEGALVATEVYHTTVQVIQMPYTIPEFTLEAEGLFEKIFDRVKSLPKYKDIDFKLFSKFSNQFLLKGEDEEAIRKFFLTDHIINFLENEEVYHIESDGKALLVFKSLRFSRAAEIDKMIQFSDALVSKLQATVPQQ
ncbi:MAG: SulP family inorganic anion transporter [Chitinophagales bacterium]|nr:SulP family inorganic anion transporter [Chitinophagales bacterium]